MIDGFCHVGLSVRDLDRAIAFYHSAFGFEVASRSKFEPGSYEGKYEAILGLREATGRVARITAPKLELELFEFSRPIPQDVGIDRPVCDYGITHFCLAVKDIAFEYERLKRAGVRFHCPPQVFAGFAVATYGRDPDGNVFELVERL